MRMDGGDLVANELEIAAFVRELGLDPGALSPLPALEAGTPLPPEATSAPAALGPSEKAEIARLFGALAAPAKVLRLHHSIGDESVGRSVLAWGTDAKDEICAYVMASPDRVLGLRSEGQVRLMVAQALAADDSLVAETPRIALTTPAALTFLAILDHIRYARLFSMLKHVAPVEVFSPEDAAARFAACVEEDFRWPLNFVEKLAPIPISALSAAGDPFGAFQELAAAGLIAPLEDSGGTRAYELTPAAQPMARDILHDVSKVGMCLSQYLEDGSLVHDVVLLIRSTFRLYLFYMTGGDSAIVTVGASDLDELLENLLSTPTYGPPKAAPAEDTMVPVAEPERTVVTSAAAPSIPLRLVVEGGAPAGKTFVLPDGGTLGRAPDNQIVIPDPGVSRKHASFAKGEGDAWVVTDLGSSNGTHVNGVKIQEPTALRWGDEIRVHDTTLRFSPLEK